MNKNFFVLLFCLFNFYVSQAQNEVKVFDKDFQILTGHWEGSITYLDYTSNKPFTMPAALDVRQIDKSNEFLFANIYPQEPKANSNDTVKISEDGRFINGRLVRSRRNLPNGDVEIMTEYLKTDGNNNSPAIIRNTYTIGNRKYVNRKDVQFELGNEWIKRSEFAYTKK